MSSPFIAEELIKQFFLYWWGTPVDSPQRKKVEFVIKRGPLQGRAVAIIVNNGPACMDKTPATLAAYRGSSLFVYHQVSRHSRSPFEVLMVTAPLDALCHVSTRRSTSHNCSIRGTRCQSSRTSMPAVTSDRQHTQRSSQPTAARLTFSPSPNICMYACA